MKRFLVLVLVGLFSFNAFSQDDSAKMQRISPIQISFVPYFSFNPVSGADAVCVSINCIGGYVPAVAAFEVGGVFNIVKSDVNGAQVAGVSNFIGGNVVGVQIAGVSNVSKNVRGSQISGVVSFNRQSVVGSQVSGVASITGGRVEGIQIAGVSNVMVDKGGDSSVVKVQQITGVSNVAVSSIMGVQVAGVSNVSKDMTGAGVAGVSNTSRNLFGCQVAGVTNQAFGKANGTQVAGVANVANEIKGSQVAGVVNVARKVDGVQVGVVNIADTLNGVAIGLVNLSRNGIRQFEVSTDEKYNVNLAFRSGAKKLHGILLLGVDPSTLDAPIWAFGYGLGTTFEYNERLSFDLDVSSQQYYKRWDSDWHNQLYKIYFGVDRKLASKLSIAAGLTANLQYVGSDQSQNHKYFSDYAPYKIAKTKWPSGRELNFWIGGKVAIRFF
ncbi:MAG TPA: hypothetical protein PK252_03190 [Bacteroidales bacterium]|nr:hypothetical protein [Bacteroidales bacterium]